MVLCRKSRTVSIFKKDLSLIGNAVEESLRLTSPVKAYCRTSAKDTEVSGVTIEEEKNTVRIRISQY